MGSPHERKTKRIRNIYSTAQLHNPSKLNLIKLNRASCLFLMIASSRDVKCLRVVVMGSREAFK